VVSSCEAGGWGLDAEWNDDFHYSLRALLTGERTGHYQDFGEVEDLAQAFREGFVYAGRYSRYREKHYGSSSRDLPGEKLVVFSQNHDQIGNRREGDRLTSTAGFEQAKLAAAAVLLAPYVPLLFMGEEYGETAPFLYFVSHGDAELIQAVRKGRSEEFARLGWTGEAPDPQSEETFERSRLNWNLKTKGRHRILLDFYGELLRLRRNLPALAQLDKNAQEITSFPKEKSILMRRGKGDSQIFAILHFGPETVDMNVPIPAGRWKIILDSAARPWGEEVPVRKEVRSPGAEQIALKPWSISMFQNADR
jgi:maltooligosyltrehalose trehalohydrolase